jgi:hypothetical protein
MQALLTVNEVVFIIVFLQCLCRLSQVNNQVVRLVRLSFTAIAMAAAYCVLSPYMWGITPTWPQIMLGVAVILRQWSTAEQWAVSLPPHILKRE